MILIFQSSFRLSKKNEKDKKRKELTPVSATPTHMLRICVNPSFNTFRRLAATGANKMPRPSRYSIAMATGSKRSSADSDSLLCHVRLWRTSRFRFGCASVCEHSKIGFILIVPSAHSPYPRCPVSATPTHMLRICVNPRHALSAGVQTMRARICSASSCDMFARVVYVRLWRVQNCQLLLCYLPHALATHGLRD